MNINFDKKPYTTNHILSGSSLSNFYRILADNNFNVDRRYYPKLLKSLLIVLLSIPNLILEKIIFNSRIRKTKIESPVFILGYPRSGTTYLVYLLSKDKKFAFCKTYECLGPHVIFTFGRVLKFIAKRALPKTRPMDNMALGATLPKEEEFAIGNMGIESMASALYFPAKSSEYVDRFVLFKGNPKEKENWKRNHSFFLKKISFKNIGKRLLLKSPFDTGRVNEILEVYPDAKFIHIHRHPYAVYSSNEELFEGVLPQTAFHCIGNEEMEQHLLYSYKATYRKYFAERELIPKKNLYEVSYEDFIGNELNYLENIYSQLELGDFKELKLVYIKELAKHKSYQTNRYSLTNEQEETVYREWKFAFDAFGYGRESHRHVESKKALDSSKIK